MRILLASVLLILVSGVGAGCQEPASSPQPTIPQPSIAPPVLSPTIEIPPPVD